MTRRPSRRARLVDPLLRAFIKRRSWGSGHSLARRARRVFGCPEPIRTLLGWMPPVRPSAPEEPRGEWIGTPRVEAPVVLYLHGGGFVAGSPATHRPITMTLARFTGARVFALDYRLAPEYRFPAGLEDCVAAYRWLCGHYAPSRIAIAGDSAGGGLTVGTLLRIRDEGGGQPACAIAFSPWTELASRWPSFRANSERCTMFCSANFRDFAVAYLGGNPEEYPEASPVNASLEGLAPMLVQVSTSETLLDDALILARRARSAGTVVEVELYADLPHCWQMLVGLVPEANLALRRAAKFIRSHTASAVP